MDEFADMDPGQEQEATGFDALQRRPSVSFGS